MKQLIKNFYNHNFVFLGKEKLSKLTILFIIILDIFIFITLGLGVDFQVKVLNNPYVTFPNQCRNIINTKDIDNFNKYFYTSNNYMGKYQSIKNEQMDSRCNILLSSKLKAVQTEHGIKLLKSEEKRLLKVEREVKNELDYIRANYNTVLFEKLSSQKLDKSIIKDNISSDNIKSKYDSYLKQNEKIKKQKENLYKKFKKSNSVKELKTYVRDNKKQINKDYKDLRKSYKVKRELITLAFLLPLLFFAFYLMKKYLEKEKYVLYIISKNILVVILIPTFISLVALIYTVMPKVFIEKVLKFFYELEIPFIVYYFAIAILVVIFGYIIIKVQKKYREDNKKLQNNNISKVDSYNRGICNLCGNKVDYQTMNFCPCCQNELKSECDFCNVKTLKFLTYCSNCGEKR